MAGHMAQDVIREGKHIGKDRSVNLGDITTYHIFVRGLALDWHHGGRSDPLTLSVDLAVALPTDFAADRYKSVVCYHSVVTAATSIAQSGSHRDLESLSEAIAEQCLGDARVESVVLECAAGTGGFKLTQHQRTEPTSDLQPLRLAVGE